VEPSLVTSWTLDPLQLAPLAVVATAYGVRARTLARRGQPVPPLRIASFATGIGLLLVALASPLAVIGEEELFAAHMAQHVLIGDLAPLCLLAGLTGPLLRPVLAIRPVERLRVLANPLVALPLWATTLVVWHVPALYDGAIRSDVVHAWEHAAFFAAGIVVWLPVLETLPAPEWFGTGAKLGYVVAVRLVETVIANVFLWSGSPFYEEYVHAVAPWGIGAQQDQALAGAVMMAEGGAVTLAALAWLFLRLAAEGEARQHLLERGLDERAVRRAVRYGRWRELERGEPAAR
jgi:cytochrome c oxidase assembly factor CtaG